VIYRELGSTGLRVSAVGFGCWGLGGDSYGAIDKKTALDTLRYAREKGVNFFDTADSYGEGASEKLTAEAFSGERDSVILATKGGTLPHTSRVMPQDFSYKYLMRAVDKSLKRLKTDRIDVYQLHSPHPDVLMSDEAFRALEDMKTSGKILYTGLSARSPQDVNLLSKNLDFDTYQINYNLIDQRAQELGVFDRAEKLSKGLIIRTPLCFGFLSGKITDLNFEKNDHRANWPQAQLLKWAEAHKKFTEVMTSLNLSPAQLALLFAVNSKAVSTVIPGMMNRAEVDENTSIAGLPALATETAERLTAIYKSNIFFDSGLSDVKKIKGDSLNEKD